MKKIITSSSNPLVKHLLRLREKSKERKADQTFLIEGVREISLAVKNHYVIDKLLYNLQLIAESRVFQVCNNSNTFIEISHEVYKKLAVRGSGEGMLAVAKSKTHSLGELSFNSSSPLVLVAEAIEKPANLGALLRTADAAKIDAFIIANPKTDIYNPNIIRTSLGAVFSTQIALAESRIVIDFLKHLDFNAYCASLQAKTNYSKQDFTQPTAFVLGSESSGLSKDWYQAGFKPVKIPMFGQVDSLNISVSGGILIFEAMRQRGFRGTFTNFGTLGVLCTIQTVKYLTPKEILNWNNPMLVST